MTSMLLMGSAPVNVNASQQKLYFLASELEKMGAPVSVAVPETKDNLALLDSLGFRGRRFLLSQENARLHIASRRRVLDGGSWDVVYSIGIGVRSLVPRRNVNHVVHDFDEWMPTIKAFPPLRRLYWRWISNRMCKVADAVTCASDYIRNAVAVRRPDLGSKIFYMPVGVSPTECRPDEAIMNSLKSRYKGRTVLFYVGSVSKMYHDQIKELVSLAEAIANEKSPYLFLIAGGGDELEYWRQVAKQKRLEGVLHFEGPVPRDHVASYTDAADVLLFPLPPTEQNCARCPTKAFHYAAANRPLVTNRTGEVLRLFGEKAFYYDTGNIADMLAACARAAAARDGYDNGISLDTISWEARARSLAGWLEKSVVSGTPNRGA